MDNSKKEIIKLPKKVKIPLVIVVLLVAFVLITKTFLWFTFTPVSLTTMVNFQYGDQNVHTKVSAEDASRIKSILNFKELYSDMPSCGFGIDVSICLDNCVYCPACDGHDIVYYKNLNLYMTLSQEEINELHTILGKYGFHFPCV